MPRVRYTLEQRLFIYDTYMRKKSIKRCRRKFRRKFPGATVPHNNAIQQLVKKVRNTGSFLDRKTKRMRTVLTEEKLDDIAFILQNSPTKSLSKLSQQTGVSTSSAWKATKLLGFKPYKVTVVQKLQEPDFIRRTHFCNWYLQSVHDGIVDPKITFFTDEAWFHLSGYMNTQNTRHWALENPHVIFEAQRNEQKVGVWCAISASRIVGPIFYEGTINSERYITQILRPFFAELSEEEKTYGFFQQDGATAHTANDSMNVLRGVFDDRIISCGLWPARSPDLTACDYYLWGNLKEKVYANNPHTLQELRDNIRNEINLISRDELQKVSQNMFKRCDDCLREGGRHFQHLL